MGWDPIYAPSGFKSFVKALELAGVPHKNMGRDFVAFTAANGDRMVVEEYVAEYDENGRGGRGCAEIVVYKWGERPPFERQEDEDGSLYQHPCWDWNSGPRTWCWNSSGW